MKKAGAHDRLIDLILSRMEQKCSPQGLNVILEELHWMGMKSITCDQLRSAVKADLRGSHPRLRAVAQDDRDMIVVDDESRPANAPVVTRPRRPEYRQLFSKLRNG